MPLGFEAPGSTICNASRNRFGLAGFGVWISATRGRLGLIVGGHTEAEGQPVGGILDRLRRPGVAPRRPNHVERPVVDVNGDGLARFGVNADQGHDGAKVDQAIDPDAERLHGISMGWWGREKGVAYLARRPDDARWSERWISTMRFAVATELVRPDGPGPAGSPRDQIRMR